MVRILLPLTYMAGIFWFSSLPGQPTPEDPTVNAVFLLISPKLQNLLHVPLFGVLAWLWHWSLRGWSIQSTQLGLIAFLLAAGYGVVDELHQLTVPGRYASLTDIGLNVLGAAIPIWLTHRRLTPR